MKKTNVLIYLDFYTVEPMAELINPALIQYLAKSLRDNQCSDVDIECWVHCVSLTNENGELCCDINSFCPM